MAHSIIPATPPEGISDLIQRKTFNAVRPPLNTIKQAGLLTQKQSDALLWKGPEELDSLNSCID